MFWVLMILFGFGLVSYHNKKDNLHRCSFLNFLGDLTACSVFALILVLLNTPVYDLRTGEYADDEAFGRLVFGLVVFSVFFGASYGIVRFKAGKKRSHAPNKD